MMKIHNTIKNSGMPCVERAQFRSHVDTGINTNAVDLGNDFGCLLVVEANQAKDGYRL